jgi:gluconolactonase
MGDVEAESDDLFELVAPDAAVERISTGHLFTEGPVWNARDGFLLWSDIAGDRIWRWTPGRDPDVYLRPSGKANGLTFDREGRLVAAGWTSRRVWRQERDGSITTLAERYDGLPINTPNDIVVRSDGAVYWTDGTSGTRHPGFETEADLQVYRNSNLVLRWDPSTDEVTLAADAAGSCNGLAFSPDESILYVNDSGARCINAFDVAADGALSNGRVFASGTGSATKVDVAGNVYCTGAGAVEVRDPAGRLLGRIRVPEKHSNLAWGEAGWSTLFVTSGRSVYRVPTRAHGVAV